MKKLNHFSLLLKEKPQGVGRGAPERWSQGAKTNGRVVSQWGSKFFIESVKASLGFQARGRDSIEIDEGYQLRKSPASYMPFFEAENEDIAPENTVFLDVKGE